MPKGCCLPHMKILSAEGAFINKVDQIHTIAREVCLKDKYSLPEKLTMAL